MAKGMLNWLFLATLAYGQTQIDLSRQVRNALPYSSGGTNATSQIAARSNVGTPKLVATDFAGADIGEKVNNAFASFGAGKCGTVVIPQGSYTYASTIYVPSMCILEGLGQDVGGTRLFYNGPAATPAIAIMNPNMTSANYAHLRNLHIATNSTKCINDGMLKWNPAAAGSNKWQCYDAVSYTAPTPHLAAILHGQINPTLLHDGTHITISDIDIDGNAGEVFPNQGGFHFGLYLNGCEECTVSNVTVHQADDGFHIGEQTNGVLFNQITARINRRAGFHFRGASSFQCNMCLFESNQWWAHPADPAQYGAGIRISAENAGTGAGRGGKFISTYFENNWVDVMTPAGDSGFIEVDNFQSIQGTFGASKWTSTKGGSPCTIPDASKIATLANYTIINGCTTTGTFNQDRDTDMVFTDRTGTFVNKILSSDSSAPGATPFAFFEMPQSNSDRNLYFRSSSLYGTTGIHLENTSPATASYNTDSATLALKGFKWSGGQSTAFNWNITASAKAPGGSPTATDKISMTNGSVNFEFLNDGGGRAKRWDAETSSPTAAVQSAAGTGATCTLESNLGVSDMSGRMYLTTGTGAWTSGGQCTITFAGFLKGWVTLTPANPAAAAAVNARQVYVDGGGKFSSQFTVAFGVADIGPTSYAFNWHAIGIF